MYLKKLEIQGFKSFADKTVMEFKPGITVVVGPNGCGKSNIADAIRWVLGEQSVKSLRGGKMEDVIFAGSEKRKSLGMAEVSLTIDNAKGLFPLEFHEVTVTRRLYRSGESDYLINKVPCRLRDIHELFMDTGVGREGISIIGQGKVDEILSVKPEERRGLIEEAAGIVKYRHRKKEAVKKLEDTESSLLRLNDIVAELISQEGPLAEQARVAAVYKEYKSELDSLEIGLIISEIEATEKRMTAIEKSRQQENSELESCRTGFLMAQAKEEQAKLKLHKIEDVLAEYQERIYETNLLTEQVESEKKLIQERIAETVRQRKACGLDVSRIAEELDGLEKEFRGLENSGRELNAVLEQKKAALSEYENRIKEESVRDRQCSDELEELKSEHFDVLQQETKASNEVISLNQRLALLINQEEQIRNKKETAGKELQETYLKIKELEKERQENTALQSELAAKLHENEKAIQAAENTLKDTRQKNKLLADEQNSLLARQKVLQEMEREGQGYGLGVREILRRKNEGSFAGIIGTVAQIISVPGEYEVAVEVALGAALQNIITIDEHVARQAIEWLKKNDKGRVTFLPLTTVQSRRDDELKAGSGILGRLSDLIKYDGRYQEIMDFLLGRVWLAEDLTKALQAAQKSAYRCRIVTLDGQVINAGGSITGGSYKTNPSGILSRKRTTRELELSIHKLEKELLEEKRKEEDLEKYFAKLQKENSDLREKLQELNIRKAENEKAQERWRAEKERFKAEKETIEWQLNEIVQEKENTDGQLKAVAKEGELLRKRISEITARMQELQEKVKIFQAERLKKNEKLTQLRIDVATVEEKTAAHQKEKSYLQQRIRQLTEYKKEKENVASQLKTKKTELEQEYNQQEAAKEKYLTALQTLERQLEKIKANRYKYQELIESWHEEAQNYSAMLKEREEKLHQLAIQESKYEALLEAHRERLFEQYGLSLEQARALEIVIDDRRAAQQRILTIKDEILSLGEVNLAAIEDYKRLKERLDFLNTQINDMTEAAKRLRRVIKEMDQIMAKRFKETFELISVAFQKMFTRLFDGGRAQLLLTDEEDILETGVDIIAQPPGKKTQHLSLLSGGEKALTAIALLMAILEVRPSPFCVLDEIESNLDETNVSSFAATLLEVCRDTQFIIISHRKGTMEIANELYGVTIEETGVSRLVSVRLEDAKREAS